MPLMASSACWIDRLHLGGAERVPQPGQQLRQLCPPLLPQLVVAGFVRRKLVDLLQQFAKGLRQGLGRVGWSKIRCTVRGATGMV